MLCKHQFSTFTGYFLYYSTMYLGIKCIIYYVIGTYYIIYYFTDYNNNNNIHRVYYYLKVKLYMYSTDLNVEFYNHNYYNNILTIVYIYHQTCGRHSFPLSTSIQRWYPIANYYYKALLRPPVCHWRSRNSIDLVFVTAAPVRFPLPLANFRWGLQVVDDHLGRDTSWQLLWPVVGGGRSTSRNFNIRLQKTYLQTQQRGYQIVIFYKLQ